MTSSSRPQFAVFAYCVNEDNNSSYKWALGYFASLAGAKAACHIAGRDESGYDGLEICSLQPNYDGRLVYQRYLEPIPASDFDLEFFPF